MTKTSQITKLSKKPKKVALANAIGSEKASKAILRLAIKNPEIIAIKHRAKTISLYLCIFVKEERLGFITLLSIKIVYSPI
ncbi:hypothetical protein F4V57_02410 [Acinetobacter qingfengensis]|uniref:hypothetical protein n=1 Tax=Acinetobacter qingfengensis TaxID=1262585 RepID=UPI00114CA9C2|nr:hypothetical protein [Acinetobacter qingfengensis]KAA8735666.1 hypothetical protein F4V57_02410 [Acinetobacter qingfengensis]